MLIITSSDATKVSSFPLDGTLTPVISAPTVIVPTSVAPAFLVLIVTSLFAKEEMIEAALIVEPAVSVYIHFQILDYLCFLL